MKIYLSLFLTFCKIGAFGFGGGYAMLPMIRQEIAEAPHNWLTINEFFDIVLISQMTPGPIAINIATFVGYRLTNSILGALIATLGVCLPPFVIMLALTKFYLKFRSNKRLDAVFSWLKPAVLGLIAAAAIVMTDKQDIQSIKSILIFAAVFILSLKKIDPIKLIIGASIAGLLIY